MAIAGSDGALHLLETARLLAGQSAEALRLIGIDRGAEWLAQAPAGYYDGSPGIEALGQRRAGGRLIDADNYHRPHLVRQVLAGLYRSGH